MINPQSIELLAPAKDLACGMAAIDHGADAVYVGAPQFGARVTAGNSLQDIEKLCDYAHLYHAQVYVALNTILTDRELEEARKLVFRLYEAGADALIIQDTGILPLDLPPIALHASTQTDNRSADKVRFWESVGIRRVILARELSLQQIREIRSRTNVELEAFVHGALCVSYSGQCYMSHACTGRSANRGACAQFCRLPYTLTDANGNVIREHSHLLSLKDMDRSASLREMIDAGICSFKIEGRLKNMDYVKNVTAYYRQALDRILESEPQLHRTSSGASTFFFTPDPAKTFNRGRTEYFLHERENVMVAPDTPKSIGEPIGKIVDIKENTFCIKTDKALHNGDGLGYINHDGELRGVRINKVEGNRVSTLEVATDLHVGQQIYRNLDIAFDKILQGESAERKISIDMILNDTPTGFALTLTDEDGTRATHEVNAEKNISKKGSVATEMLRQSLAKLGGTPFRARNISIVTSDHFFIPNSQVNEWRRAAAHQLEEKRRTTHQRPPARKADTHSLPFPTPDNASLDYRANIHNCSADDFYHQHGVDQTSPSFEAGGKTDGIVMTCKHCIRYSLGFCSKNGKKLPYTEPLALKTGKFHFELHFDCKKCEMTVLMSENNL